MKNDDSLLPLDPYHPALDIYIPVHNRRVKITMQSESTYNFKKANFVRLYTSLKDCNWKDLYDSTDVNNAVNCLYNNINTVMRETVPLTMPKGKSKYPLWFTFEIIRKLKAKEHHRKHKHISDYSLNQFKLLRKEVKSLIKLTHRNYINSVEDGISNNPKKFWTFIKNKQKNNGLCNSFHYNNIELSDCKTIVEGFASYFESVYSTVDQSHYNIPDVNSTTCDTLNITCILRNEVEIAIKKLKSKSTAGPDMIPPFIIKGCANILIDPLLYIYNLSIKTSLFPSAWKVSRVCPVLKSGHRSAITNYRPISILSSVAKVFEFILYNRMSIFIKQIISECQHGFVPNRSTVTNLINFYHDVSNELDSAGQTDVIYTDFEKAFDKINHDVLIKKLAHLGFSYSMLNFFCSYLLGRRQYVYFQRNSSRHYLIKSGIPQGSNLGPLMFLIFINDLPKCISNSSCLLYADDLKIYKPIKTINDCLLLQNDLNKILLWSIENKLNFNVKKCTSMIFTRKKKPIVFAYKLGVTELQSINEVNDLGVLFDRELSLSPHVCKLVSGSYKTLGFVLRNIKMFTSSQACINIYQAFIRSKLEYASVIWNPRHDMYILRIEQIQKRFLRHLHLNITGNYPYMVPYKDLLDNFQMVSLENRRAIDDMKFLYKVVNAIIDNSYFLSLLNFHVPRVNSRANLTFKNKKVRTTSHNNSPLYRLCNKYNSAAYNNNRLDFSTTINCFLSEFVKTMSFVIKD